MTPDLYQRLFPTGAQGDGSPRGGRAGLRAGREAKGSCSGAPRCGPYVSASWVDADVLAFDNPVPVRDQYLQVAPGVTASLPLFDGVLAAEYEPRFRFFSDIPLVNETSHFAGVRYEVPIGSRVFLRLGQRYTRAILETTVVDPGREYFYNLSRYTFNATTAAARVDLGAAALRRGRGGLGLDPLRPGAARAASSTTTPARCGPAWATMWAAT